MRSAAGAPRTGISSAAICQRSPMNPRNCHRAESRSQRSSRTARLVRRETASSSRSAGWTWNPPPTRGFHQHAVPGLEHPLLREVRFRAVDHQPASLPCLPPFRPGGRCLSRVIRNEVATLDASGVISNSKVSPSPRDARLRRRCPDGFPADGPGWAPASPSFPPAYCPGCRERYGRQPIPGRRRPPCPPLIEVNYVERPVPILSEHRHGWNSRIPTPIRVTGSNLGQRQENRRRQHMPDGAHVRRRRPG